MENLLLVIKEIALALIFGGGILMGTCVRPLLVRELGPNVARSQVALIDGLRIYIWERYDYLALICTLVLILIEGLEFIYTGKVFSLQLVICLALGIILIRKLFYHQFLKAQLPRAGNGPGVYGTLTVPAQEQELKMWSIATIILTAVLIVLSFL